MRVAADWTIRLTGDGMQAAAACSRALVSGVLAGLVTLACSHDAGPPPFTPITIQGRITSSGPNPVPLQGATVLLREWLQDNARARATTDAAGEYELNGSCDPEFAKTQMWIEVSAAGYWMGSTAADAAPTDFSEPPIYCKREPQVVNLTLRAPPTLVIRGRIVAAGPTPVPVPGASVHLKRFYNPEIVATTTSDAAGSYEVSYRYPSASPCDTSDDSGYVIEAAAVGYATATSAAPNPDGPFVSDPPIYCTGDPQVLDLSLEPQ